MKNLSLLSLCLIAISIFFSSCYTTSYTADYRVNFKETEHRNGKNSIIVPIEKGSSTYSDSIIEITWSPSDKEFSFELKNKTQSTLKIIWDETVFVDPLGGSGQVMHSGIKYIDRNNSHPPTTILRNSTLSDIVVPTENVYYRESSKYSSGGWETTDLFYIKGTDSANLKKNMALYNNKLVQIGMPIKVDDNITEYIFVFSIDDLKMNVTKDFNFVATYASFAGIVFIAAMLIAFM